MPLPTQMTPLHLAAYFNSSAAIVNALIKAGADIEAADSDQDSPLHHASRWNPAVVPVLIGARCKVNVLDKLQYSPLFFAAYYSEDRSAVAAALMAAAADPHQSESFDIF